MWSPVVLFCCAFLVAVAEDVTQELPLKNNESISSSAGVEADAAAAGEGARRCVPTAVARGPCHACVCAPDGVFHCRADDCRRDDEENFVSGAGEQAECEPGQLYNEGILWCSCGARGRWRSDNCRDNFRFVRTKKVVRAGPGAPPRTACRAGSFHVLDCNVCECRLDVISPAACTNRTCVSGLQSDRCKLGQVLRLPDRLCSCSEDGSYVDKYCINVSGPPTALQEIDRKELAVLTLEEHSSIPTAPDEKCVPNTIVHRDCNRCRCTELGEMVCTAKLCISAEGNSSAARGALRSRHSQLPELASEDSRCTPGLQYRLRCNTCTCTQAGVPSCTSMICLDDQGPPAKTEQRGNKKKYNRAALPLMKAGERCTPGVAYREACNVCRCTPARALVCTKMLCLDNNEQVKKQIFQKLYKDKHSRVAGGKADAQRKQDIKVNSAYRESLNKVKILKGDVTKGANEKVKNLKLSKSVKKDAVLRQGDNKVVESENRADEAEASKSQPGPPPPPPPPQRKVYPELPSTKCQAGAIYQKGCQRCFCSSKKIPHCTNRPCEEMQGPVLVPRDVYPKVAPKEFEQLRPLAHEAARCLPGRVYRVQCNVCLCLFNGNLLCNNLLCLAVDEVNRIAAIKATGTACKKGKNVDPEVDCITCECKGGKLACEAVGGCTPYRLRRALHGELGPRVIPEAAIDAKEGKCVPGMVYRENCNNCYCQEDGSLRCTRKGCLNFQQVQKLKKQRERLLKLGL